MLTSREVVMRLESVYKLPAAMIVQGLGDHLVEGSIATVRKAFVSANFRWLEENNTHHMNLRSFRYHTCLLAPS